MQGLPSKKIKNYYEYLNYLSHKFETDYDGILKFLPVYYKLLCNISNDKKISWHTRMLINAALSYLVIDKDYIRDDIGPEGLLDDLFIFSFVLKEIRDKVSKDIIVSNAKTLEINEGILQLIFDTYSKSSLFLGNKTSKILEFVGLNKFNLFDFLYTGEANQSLSAQKKKRNLIYSMLAVKTKGLFEKIETTPMEDHMKTYIAGHPEFIEIQKFMEFIK